MHTVLAAWDWRLSVILGCLGLFAAYALLLRFQFTQRFVWFLLGVAFLLLGLVSPLNVLARRYLYSAQSIQYLMLGFVVPGLLVLSLPGPVLERALRLPWIRAIEDIVKHPATGFIAAFGAMIVFHLPRVFDAVQATGGLHRTAMIWFMISGALFWWPVIAPLKTERLKPVPAGAVYLIAACVVWSLASIVITFTRMGDYHTYFNPADSLGILPALRETWGFTNDVDQETGGTFLWVGGCMIFSSTVMALFIQWYRSSEVKNEFAPKPEEARKAG